MGYRESVHRFAKKYLKLYSDPKTKEWDVAEVFAEYCKDLEFEMDCGKRFSSAYSSDALNDSDALLAKVDSIDDVAVLASGIFSQWRYLTHWSYGAHLLDETFRRWFIITFRRLAELTAPEEKESPMSTITIQKISITDITTDAIVNAANDGLWAGGGVYGAIFTAAGHDQLQAACNAIGHCSTGSAVITPGFQLKAKYIIHAVGPRWNGGNHKEPQLLYSAYTKSLELATENGCRSIAFPLISAGIYGYPLEGAWRKALQACRDYLEKGKQIDIVFAVLDERILQAGRNTLAEIAPQYAGSAGESISKQAKLNINGCEVDAVFFHLPTEPDGYLSNWYPSVFTMDGIRYTCAEQYIMHQKCKLFGDNTAANAILATDDPAEQQTIGRKAKGYHGSVWAGMRQIVALCGLYAKFSQNPALKQQLLATGEAWLVECAHWDTTWACGIRLNDERRFDAREWCGENLLGFALMEARRQLRGEG